MCQHINIGGSTVEVGEYERRLVRLKLRAISAHMLVRTRFEVKQIIFHHEIKEFTAFGRHFMIHFRCSCDHFVLATVRRGISLRIEKRLVVILHLVDTELFRLHFHKSVAKRRYVFSDKLTEIRNILGGIIISAACGINIVDIRIESEITRLRATVSHQPVIDLVQLRRNLLIHFCPRFKRFATFVAVGRFHMLQQAVEIALLPPEIGGAESDRLAVFVPELVLGDGKGNVSARRETYRHLGIPEQYVAEFLLEPRAEL